MKEPAVSLVDRIVGVFSPMAGLRRFHARTVLSGLTNNGSTKRAGFGVKSKGAGSKGTLYNKNVKRHNRITEGLEREDLADRAQDLAANDPHASSAVESLPVNVIGTGLVPQSQPHIHSLGLEPDQVREFQRQAEWVYKIWSRRASACGRMTFEHLQYLNFRSVVVNGEFVNIPVMRRRPRAKLQMSLQAIDPLRLRTPIDKFSDKSIRDGVVLGPGTDPVAYWIAEPDDGMSVAVSSGQFRRIPAWRGHRRMIFHNFFTRDNEQVRGWSMLEPVIKLFYDAADYLDYELVGAIVAASFPVFLETGSDVDPADYANDISTATETRGDDSLKRVGEIEPGQMYVGTAGQKPHVIENKRPTATFEPFLERVLRSIGAALHMPYEILAKDFSKTNYSSARAAMLEFWRAVVVDQAWMRDGYCQPVWEMVLEEAYLRGLLTIPQGAPGFYEAFDEWTNAYWLPPRRGHVDPVKEMEGLQRQRAENAASLGDVCGEMGRDAETVMDQIAREKEYAQERGVNITPALLRKNPTNQNADNEQDEERNTDAA